MSPEIACIVGLVVLFVVGTALPVNMGALAFVMAFFVGGLYVDMPAAAVLAGFPGDLFVTLVGITYLFAIAQNNGAIDWLVRQAGSLGARPTGGDSMDDVPGHGATHERRCRSPGAWRSSRQ